MKGPTSSDKRLKLFENRWLEQFTVVSVGWFCAIWAIVLPLVAFTAWGTVSVFPALALVLTGLVAWSLFEYVAHRHLFHCEVRGQFMQQTSFVLHGNHHVQPSDKLRCLMPPIVSIPIGAAIWATLHAVVGETSAWFFFGFLLGYVAYDLTHYACHQWPMRGPLGKRLKRHHMQHHFISDSGNFAVTSLYWDYVFGTRVAASGKQGSPKARSGKELNPAE